jgi:hypothetical protein
MLECDCRSCNQTNWCVCFALNPSQGARGLESIASAGNSGRNPQNLQRALISAFGWPKGAPNFTWADIPMEGHARAQPHPFICPHELFGKLYHDAHDMWDVAVGGGIGANTNFWNSCLLDPDISSHPGLQSESDRKNTIPSGMRGDGGAFSKNDSLLTISWNSLVGDGPTMNKRFVVTTLMP